MRLNPLTLKKIKRFRSIKRGYYSLLIMLVLILFSIFAELLINSKALVVHYEGKFYFPTYSDMVPGNVFGLDYAYETNYRELQKKLQQENQSGNWMLMPVVPYNPLENDLIDGEYPPYPPSWENKHFLGTDTIGRDIVARLFYGFRIAIFFSIILLISDYVLGVSIGCAMGYIGGKFDLFFQRVIEVLSNVPFLYVMIIISSIITPNFFILILIMSMFGWMGMTWQMRTSTYREKAREYVLAARALGASNSRIIFVHILPNTISLIITYIPFAVAGGIVGLTSLDYLGFGLRPPTPSWGDLLQQGWGNLQAYWIGGSVIIFMILTLTAVTFVGEAIREAFDPKLHTTYE